MMNEQVVELLLQEFRAFRDTEFREFRDDVASWRQETGERNAALETQMKEVRGNGQPGRLGIVEAEVKAVQRWRYKVIGIAAGVSTVVSAAAWVLTKVMR
jgi:hypothetical protein